MHIRTSTTNLLKIPIFFHRAFQETVRNSQIARRKLDVAYGNLLLLLLLFTEVVGIVARRHFGING